MVLSEAIARIGSRAVWWARHRETARDLDNARLRFDRDLGWGWDEEERFRGRRDVPTEKAPDLFRAIAVGDSCTRGVGVHPVEAFPWQLEEMLRKQDPPLRVEVLNGGVKGYRSAQMADYLERDLLAYAPDLAIVYANPLDGSDRPAGAGELLSEIEWHRRRDAARENPAVEKMRRFLFRSRAYYLLRKFLAGTRETSEPLSVRETQQSKNLLRMRAACGSIGAEMIIVEYVVKKFEDGRDALFAPDSNARRPWEAPFVRVYPAMMESGYAAEELFQDGVHPTRAGHRIIARLIAQKIDDLGLIAKEASERTAP
ncbi:MAG: GDSL-type esterase/lipase family protein [Deltaproteobacteria bacterium]|nr:GDSL-type esterase/lipase family protein [Deltaproteobacteria bacterium]